MFIPPYRCLTAVSLRKIASRTFSKSEGSNSIRKIDQCIKQISLSSSNSIRSSLEVDLNNVSELLAHIRMHLPFLLEKPGHYSNEPQYVLGQLFLTVAKHSLPVGSIIPMSSTVSCIETIPFLDGKATFDDILYDAQKSVEDNIFIHVKGEYRDDFQSAYRGTTISPISSSFDGNARIIFYPSSPFGIHVPSLLDQLIMFPHEHLKSVSEILECSTSLQLRDQAKILKNVFSLENEIILPRPIIGKNIVNLSFG